MSIAWLMLANLVALGACRTEPSPRRAAIGNHGGTVVPIDASDGPCVDECVRERQMQAMSMDAIRASCRRDCSGLPPLP
jgi:hypothetical protein